MHQQTTSEDQSTAVDEAAEAPRVTPVLRVLYWLVVAASLVFVGFVIYVLAQEQRYEVLAAAPGMLFGDFPGALMLLLWLLVTTPAAWLSWPM